MAIRAPLCALLVLLSCSKGAEPSEEAQAASADPVVRPVLQIGPDGPITKREHGTEALSAEELLGLVRQRNDGYELSAEQRAALAEYDGVLESIMLGAAATGLVPDTFQPHLTTRDYELWVLPGGNDVCFTVHDRDGKALAERIDEAALSRDFPYLHNLLHPEYMQFYDVVGY